MTKQIYRPTSGLLKFIGKNQALTVYQKIRLLFGTFALFGGLILLSTNALFIEHVTTSFFVLTPDSIMKSLWIKSPFPITTDVYMFNWTNPEDFYDASIKPKFQETGPYRFLQYMEKVDLSWHLNDTVSFKQMKTFYYDEELPNGNVSDVVTTLNFITAILADIIQNENYFVRKGISMVINTLSPKIHYTKTVSEYIFGIEDFLLSARKSFPFGFNQFPTYERTGLLSAMNMSADFSGLFNIATGVNGHFDVQTWNDFTITPYYKEPCGSVRGTLGEFYGRKVSKDFIIVFVADMCRYVKFDFEEEVTVKGIPGYKYIIGNSILDNGTMVDENKCFCDGDCIPSGMLSVSSCKFGLPAYLSLPHFYRADPIYQEAVEGLRPEEVNHEAYIVVEPKTGIPIAVSVAMQVNILVHPVAGIDVYEEVRKIFFPLCWVKQSAVIPDGYALLMKIYLYLPEILTTFSVLLILLGSFLAIFKNEPIMDLFGNLNHSRKSSKIGLEEKGMAEQMPLMSSEENESSC